MSSLRVDPCALTPAEARLAVLLDAGVRQRDIAVQLGLSPRSVERITAVVREKREAA